MILHQSHLGIIQAAIKYWFNKQFIEFIYDFVREIIMIQMKILKK